MPADSTFIEAELSPNLPPRLVLASASPRRRELFALFGLPYEIIPSRYEEPTAPAHPVSLAEFTLNLATEKAREVAGRTANAWVIGADTEVSLEAVGTPLGKPQDTADAARMLKTLSGRSHLVCTGVALIKVSKSGEMQTPVQVAVSTLVTFRSLSDAMIAAYVATGEPMDKAGAYGAQGHAAPFIERIEGDFFNVVGLPICALGQLLEGEGLDWQKIRSENKEEI